MPIQCFARFSFALLIVCTSLASKAEESRYDEMLKSASIVNTVKSLGTAFLALPTEREQLEPQLASVWWANNPVLGVGEARRDIEMARFKQQLDGVQDMVVEHRISRLILAGATPYGTVNNLDLFFVAETYSGPMAIRVSVYFSRDRGPFLFAIDSFKGFSDCREVLREIKHPAGKQVFSVDINQDQKPQPGDAHGAS